MADSNGGANTADSYIGSLISLTSKSEIRYEGILYTVDTENSNIALQNVRSFGTEGRKKDGLPIYASDKVYDYIIFRGSDIKDLQVKSSPSVQPPPQPPTDPAIISLQSQYSQSASIPPAYVQPPPGPQDAPPQLPYPGLPPAAYRGGVPQMYHPTPAWGPSPPAGPNGNLAGPMYWQGYYRAPGGRPMMQQQIAPQPPLSLPQSPLPQPNAPPAPQPPVTQAQAPLPDALQQLASRPTPPVALSDAGPPVASQLQQASARPAPSSSSIPAVFGSAPAASAAPPVPPGVSASVSAAAPTTVVASVPVSQPVGVPAAMQGVSAVVTPAAKNPRRVVGPSQPAPPQSQVSGATLGTPSLASSTNASVNLRPQTTQPLPGGLLTSGKIATSSISQKQEPQTAEPVKSQRAISLPGQTSQQQTQPLLPLPNASTPQRQLQLGTGTGGPNYVRRGRGRAGGGSGRGLGLTQPAQQFTEDFDFMAMNKKFNKNEVWGVLGNKGDSGERVPDVDEEEGVEGNDFNDIPDGSSLRESPKKQSLYIKDDFFDSLSCDALDREGSRPERTKFSEQRKIDTETFGSFPLRGRGGRRSGRRGGFRGAYYGGGGYMSGRGNGSGRGRGVPRSATAIN